METAEKKPPCEYGSKCYRKNPKHFEDFSHPSSSEHDLGSDQNTGNVPKRPQAEEVQNSLKNSLRGPVKMKQTTIQFGKNKNQVDSTTVKEVSRKLVNAKKNVSPKKLRDKNSFVINSSNKEKLSQSKGVKNAGAPDDKFDTGRKRSKQNDEGSDPLPKKLKNSKIGPEGNTSHSSGQTESKDDDDSTNEDEEEVTGSWTFIKKDLKTTESKTVESDLKNKPVEEIIKTLFLVEMPPCFYSFFEFCKSLNKDNPEKSLQICGLHLVGPFDVLLGKMNLSVAKELALCHWRFFYDPPEFQTVLRSTTELHIGYWRDNPNEPPVFLVSNDSAKDCTIKMEAENIFGTVFHYCEGFIKTCDPFLKVKISQLQKKLSEWAEEHNFTLEKKTDKMMARQKKVVAKSFHKLGLVVPVNKKTELGYRPLIESEKNIKKICTLIMSADDDNERETLWEKLQPLITAANIANDECDFGNGLELGIDLFCMGSPVFHETIEHLLTVAYSLLNRPQFEEIIRAHLKRRKKGVDLSIN